MRAFLLRSVAITALALTPVAAWAQAPGGEHGPGGGEGAGHPVPGGGAMHQGGGGAMQRPGPGGGAPMQHGPGAPGGERAQAQPNASKGGAMEHQGGMEQKGAMQPKGDITRGGSMEHKGGQMDHAGPGPGHGAHPPAISGAQRTKVQSAFRGVHGAERIGHADFSVRVGGLVPRHYHYYPLPPEIIDIVPEYSGYDYVEVGDEILILDPDTGEIVYVIED